MKNKSLAIVALLSCSLTAYADLPNMWRNPVGFHFGATGYYLQPNASGDDLAYGYPQTPTVLTGATSQMKIINPKFYGAYSVNAGYTFYNLVDISANYFYYNTSNTSKSSPVLPGQTFTIDNPNADNTVGGVSTVNGKAKYRINQIDLMVGKTFVSCEATIHPSLGVRYTDLKRFESTNATLIADAVSTLTSDVVNFINEKSHYSGVGPLVGLDASYHFMGGFELVGHVDGGLLVGNIDSSNSQTSMGTIAGTALTLPAYSSWGEDRTHRIVPTADIKLGIAFQFPLDCQGCSNGRVEAGWLANHYWSSVDRIFANGAGTTNGNFIANINGITTTSDVGFSGPYINLTFTVA